MNHLRVRRAPIFSLLAVALGALVLAGCDASGPDSDSRHSPAYSVGEPVNVPPPPTYRGPPVNVRVSARPAPIFIVQ